ncbi:sporulation membrane protein YtaF [Aeribacillus pallidus]|uniref:sporulation membrane protein YtaF n=1 Tax=Aeribacillus pallidus TaxID=33936 RepID=UPI0021504D7E|nr:sporulation membrane protein YtaF [Aeribacillus pallidus]
MGEEAHIFVHLAKCRKIYATFFKRTHFRRFSYYYVSNKRKEGAFDKMTEIGSVLILALAVSLDSFSVGLAFGLRKVKIPIKSIITISCCSAIVLLAAMMAGQIAQSVLPPYFTDRLGGAIFILLGMFVLYSFFRNNESEDEKDEEKSEKTILNMELKSLGIVIHILKKPAAVDMDRSGEITGVEALLLGIALSLDSFGAGIGAALAGYEPFLTAIFVTCMSTMFVYIGMKSGRFASSYSFFEKFSFIPGLLLIMIGVWAM